MLDALLITIFMLAGAGLGFYGLDLLPPTVTQGANVEGARIVTSGFGVLAGLVLGSIVRWSYRRFEANVRSLPPDVLITRSVGLVIGLVIANLAMAPVYLLPLPQELNNFIEPLASVFFSLSFAYLGVSLADTHGPSLLRLFNPNYALQVALWAEGNVVAASAKVLDTSSIIDGRLAQLIETGFLEGTLVVPRFVLAELQTIADKADAQKRERGRKGLDTLQALRQDYPERFVIHETDYPDLATVDDKLVRLTQTVGGTLLTTDFNLKKVAMVQNVKVLNVNELAEALRPLYIAGDSLDIKITREGKEPGQGVGYLDDGTMVVVEEGQRSLGKTRSVVVTSAIQTSAGRMIFARLNSAAAPTSSTPPVKA
ncbi:PIN/TRAM domain-containing protein [Synechococcus sp. Nb3U1]|uniref:PIN/TRAM domain-containing protein n=1 Tax=Synechococcus sp. Nb3U1 TaxID=1914529 RepID=UPI001F34074A|nr:PIN/TRAM domain-containing protein [Synechococcus sp. Nb3U1]MCF2971526.1 PIN/TRAM domain-containing protein [Synechococcus sp. Nb3U1]